MSAIESTTNSRPRGCPRDCDNRTIDDAATLYTRVASIAATIDVSDPLIQQWREAIANVKNNTIEWKKSLFPITMTSIKHRRSTEFYHPKDPRRERQLTREKEEFLTRWTTENCDIEVDQRQKRRSANDEERDRRDATRSEESVEATDGELREIKKNEECNEKAESNEDDCECLGVSTKEPVIVVTIEDDDETIVRSTIEPSNRKRGYEDDANETRNNVDFDTRSSTTAHIEQDTCDLAVHRSPEATPILSTVIDDCAPVAAKRSKYDNDVETPELLDERVGNVNAFLVRIPRAAITLKLNSYNSSSRKNLSYQRPSTEIRSADSSVPDESSPSDENPKDKCDSSTVTKKPKIIDDVTCLEGTIYSASSLQKFTKRSVDTAQEETSLIETKIKDSHIPTKHVRIIKKFRSLFGNEETPSESDEENRLTSRLTSKKRRKESRMSSDSGVFVNELTSDSVTSEIPEQRLANESPNVISSELSEEHVRSMPLLDHATSARINVTKIHEKALPDSSTSSEDKTTVSADSSSNGKLTILIEPANTQDSDVFDPLRLEIDLSAETQISTPTSTTSCLPIVAATSNDASFEDFEDLVGMDVKKGCHISMSGNRISIQEDSVVEPLNYENDDETDDNRLIIDECSINDDPTASRSSKDCEPSSDDQRIFASASDSCEKEISVEAPSHGDASESSMNEFIRNFNDDSEAELTTHTRENICSVVADTVSLKESCEAKETIDNTGIISDDLGSQVYLAGGEIISKNSPQRLIIISATVLDIDSLPVLQVDRGEQSCDRGEEICRKNLAPATRGNEENVSKDSTVILSSAVNVYSNLRLEQPGVPDDTSEVPKSSKTESQLEESTTLVDRIADQPRTISNEIPDSELPVFLVEPERTKDVPKISKLRVRHPSELGSRWCPTPLDAGSPQSHQHQDPSNSSLHPPAPPPPYPSMHRSLDYSSHPFPPVVIAQTRPAYSSISQHPQYPQLPPATIAQTPPAAYSSISQHTRYPSTHPLPPAPMTIFPKPTPLDHMQQLVTVAASRTVGVQDLSYKSSATYRLSEAQPSPINTGRVGAGVRYSGQNSNLKAQTTATTTLPPTNPYYSNTMHIIDKQKSMMFNIFDCLLCLSSYVDIMKNERDTYKISQLGTEYSKKRSSLFSEVFRYSSIIGMKDIYKIIEHIVQCYEQLIPPNNRLLNYEKVIGIFRLQQLPTSWNPNIVSSANTTSTTNVTETIAPMRSSLLTDSQQRQLWHQIRAYGHLSNVLHYQLIVQTAEETARLNNIATMKPKRTRKKRVPSLQEQTVRTNVEQAPAAPIAPTYRINYQETIDDTIEQLMRERTHEKSNAYDNGYEKTVDRCNFPGCTNEKTAHERSIESTVATNVREIFRLHPVERNPQDMTVVSAVQDEIDQEMEVTEVESVGERSTYSSLEDANTSVLDVLKELEILDSMAVDANDQSTTKVPSITEDIATNNETTKEASAIAEIVDADDESTTTPLITEAIATNGEIAKESSAMTETVDADDESTTKIPPNTVAIATNDGTAIEAPAIIETVDAIDESATTTTPPIIKATVTNKETTREIPVITLDDEDDWEAGTIAATIARTDEFSILEVKSISKDVFNNLGDTVDDATTLVIQTNESDERVNDTNDSANECIDIKAELSNCFQCGKLSSVVCEQCRSAFYCSTECHQEHWSKTHHLTCKRVTEMSEDVRDKNG